MSKSLEPEDLLLQCAAGEATAQRRLYELFYPYGMSIALHYAGNRPEAEEIVQDAFVKYFRQLLKQLPAGDGKAYFSRVVINTAIDLLRRRARRPQTDLIEHGESGISGTVRNTGEDELQRGEIFRLLQLLPASYRLVFNLYVLEEMKHPEIARRLRISEGTSRSHLFKARKLLRGLATRYYHLNSASDV